LTIFQYLFFLYFEKQRQQQHIRGITINVNTKKIKPKINEKPWLSEGPLFCILHIPLEHDLEEQSSLDLHVSLYGLPQYIYVGLG